MRDAAGNLKMRLSAVILVLFWAVECFGNDFVLETKSIRVVSEPALVATNWHHVVVRVNLPVVLLNSTSQSYDNCSTYSLPQIVAYCTVGNSLDQTGFQILSELTSIFQKGDDLSLRTRRYVAEGIGNFRRWFGGSATIADLDDVISKVNELGQRTNSLASTQNQIYNSTVSQANYLQNLSVALQAHLNTLGSSITTLESELINVTDVTDYVLRRHLGNLVLKSKIDLLQTHLSALRSIYESCNAGRLSRLAVNIESLSNMLSHEIKGLSQKEQEFVFPNVNYLYTLDNVHCSLEAKDTLSISLALPIKSVGQEFKVLSIAPLKFIYDKQTCQLVKSTVKLAHDGETFFPLDPALSFGKPLTYLVRRFVSESATPRCVQSLLKEVDVNNIVDNCPLLCENVEQTTIEELSANVFSVLNPHSALHIVCDGKVRTTVKPLIFGRYEIRLPCECNLQDAEDSTAMFVHQSRYCGGATNTTLSVTDTWADDRFSSAPLFIFRQNSSNIKDINVTLPALTFITPAPPAFNHVWHDMPLASSGKAESILLSLAGLALTGLGVYWVLGKLGLLPCIASGFSGLWSVALWCCRSAATSTPEQQEATPVAPQPAAKRPRARPVTRPAQQQARVHPPPPHPPSVAAPRANQDDEDVAARPVRTEPAVRFIRETDGGEDTDSSWPNIAWGQYARPCPKS